MKSLCGEQRSMVLLPTVCRCVLLLRLVIFAAVGLGFNFCRPHFSFAVWDSVPWHLKHCRKDLLNIQNRWTSRRNYFFSWKQTASAVGLSFGSQQGFNTHHRASCGQLPPPTSLPDKMPQKYPWASFPGSFTAQDLWVSLSLPFNCGLWTYSVFLGALFFSIPFHVTLSGLALWNKRLCVKDLRASRPFLCLIMCGIGLLINACLYSRVSHNPASYSVRLAGTGGVVGGDPSPRLFSTVGNEHGVYCGSRQTLSYPAAFHFSIPLRW